MTTVAILGANGVYARHLIPRLAAKGYSIRALVRRPETATIARACGADIRVADIFDTASLRDGLAGADFAVNLATALSGGDFEMNDKLRREGSVTWAEACKATNVRVVQQSIAWISGGGDQVSDEDTPLVPGEDGQPPRASAAALEMEANIRAAGLDAVILRGALFYGPGTGNDDGWFSRAAAGKLRLPGDGSGWVTLVHIADMAEATVATLERWPSGETFIVADDTPVQWRDLFGYVAAAAGAPPPEAGGFLGFPSFRLTNRKVKDLLGWQPMYPSYRIGLVR